jgi:hypothetical protein
MHALERIHERHGINQDQVLDMVRERARERGCTLREAFEQLVAELGPASRGR